MKKSSKIYLAGHDGLVGSAVSGCLMRKGYKNVVTRPLSELDLTDFKKTTAFFKTEKPEYVILAAAKVGGIFANDTFPVDFIQTNLKIQTNVIEAAYKYKAKKLLFLGSSCIYPKHSKQPMKEEYLLSGKLEPTNEPYAIAKIAGIILCKSYNRQYGTNFIAAMPTNLYGPNDNFDLKTSHVLPALVRKFHEAKKLKKPHVELWGTGSPKREFLFVDDLAEGLVFLLEKHDVDPKDHDSLLINIGTGEDITIKDLALLVNKTVGYKGNIRWNSSMPDGTPRKLLDVTRIKSLGWKPKTSLQQGIEETYNWYKSNIDGLKP